MIFNSNTLTRLKRLQLVAQHVKSGAIRGDRRSTKRGQSIEFADYRNYVPGDDLRQLDWNIYARHDQPFIKLMEDEEDMAVYILIDGSESMNWGEGELNKFDFSRQLAAGLGVVSLFTGDRLQIEVWGGNSTLGPMRGPANMARMLDFLETQKTKKSFDLQTTSHQFYIKNKRAGLVIFISDMLFENGYEDGLKQLQNRGHEVLLLHTLSPDELIPEMNGDLQLIDIEDDTLQDVSISPGILDVYQERVHAWQTEMQDFCINRNIRYMPINTKTGWDEFILYELRKQGVVV